MIEAQYDSCLWRDDRCYLKVIPIELTDKVDFFVSDPDGCALTTLDYSQIVALIEQLEQIVDRDK